MTPAETSTLTVRPESPSPLDQAQNLIEQLYRGNLPNDIVDYWISRTPTWEAQNTPQSFSDWMKRIGHVPDQKFDRTKINPKKKDELLKTGQEIDREASQEYLKQIEPWVLGDLQFSTDLIASTHGSQILNELRTSQKVNLSENDTPAVINLLDQIKNNQRVEDAAMQLASLVIDASYKNPRSKEKIESSLPSLMGAVARRNYARRLNQIINKIQKAKRDQQPELITELEQQLVTLKTPEKKEDFLVRSVRAQKQYYKKLLKQPNLAPLALKMNRITHASNRRLINRAPEIRQVIERDDGTFVRIDMDLLKVGTFSWLQPTWVEDPSSDPNSDKGVTLILMHTNPDTLEVEYFMCYTKRDSLDPNESITASHQTSWGRAQNPELNPTWQLLKDAINGTGSALFSPKTGVLYAEDGLPLASITHQSPNGNRFKNSGTAHVVLNLDALHPEKQTSIPSSLVTKVKILDREVPSHFWLTSEQINLVATKGLPDIKNPDLIHAAINSFARSTIQGAESMKYEIRAKITSDRMRQAGFNDQTIKDLFEGKQTKFESSLTSEQTTTLEWLTYVLLKASLNGARQHQFEDTSKANSQLN